MPESANLSPAPPAAATAPAGLPLAAWSPWPRCCPWVVIGLGVALGTVVGFSPWLFLLIGVSCLLSGWLPVGR